MKRRRLALFVEQYAKLVKSEIITGILHDVLDTNILPELVYKIISRYILNNECF